MFGWFENRAIDAPQLEDLFSEDYNKALARHIVLNEIKPLDDKGIWCHSSKYVRTVIVGTDALALNIARQIALTCHYPDFDDEKGCNRTVVTIVAPNASDREDVEAVKKRFESITGCLLAECICRCEFHGKDTVVWNSHKSKSFIDLEFEFVGLAGADVNQYIKGGGFDADAIVSVLDSGGILESETVSWIERNLYQYYAVYEDRLRCGFTDYRIDVNRASFVNMLYEAGSHLEDIFILDIFKVTAYKTAIESFCRHTSARKRWLSWNEINDVSLKISSLNCADGLNIKIRSAEKGGLEIKKLNGAVLECFARSEHTRWSVEKLISGYRPYTAMERYDDELLFSDPPVLKAARKRLKTEHHAHIDICSCNELMRTDFESYKYDILLTLAADYIISVTN